jgi:acyl-CoA synthetase (AMP-forming)/AMP-acid ligase II
LRRILGEALTGANCQSFSLTRISTGKALVEEVDPDSLGLVQFSSGTTVDPKPVALTHRALMAQTTSLNGFWPDTPEVRHSGVSWLPLYHDMGLIGCVFTVLERPSTLTLIPPELFVARPAVWLRTLSRYRATISPAPNFAFGLCTEKIRDEELRGVELSNWRVALCGAETVVPAVLDRFADRFAPFGFRPEALTPVYGLSEAALAVTFSDIDKPYSYRSVSRDRPVGNSAAELQDIQEEPNRRRLVSVGRPLPGFEVEVRNQEGDALTGSEAGRIWIRGPSLMREYLNQPQATSMVLRDGWLDTGDVGFLHAGELYVSGRAKDVLIVRGANHSPDEIEAMVSELEAVRTGCAAAVGHLPENADREEIWLFVERSREGIDKESDEIIEACKHQALAHTGIALDRVEVLELGTLPRTSSGKIRRQRALELFLVGDLHPPERVTRARILHAMGRSMWAQLRHRRPSDVG